MKKLLLCLGLVLAGYIGGAVVTELQLHPQIDMRFRDWAADEVTIAGLNLRAANLTRQDRVDVTIMDSFDRSIENQVDNMRSLIDLNAPNADHILVEIKRYCETYSISVPPDTAKILAEVQDPETTAAAISRYQSAVSSICGHKVPDLTFTTLDNRFVHLSDLRGKVVLLNFFGLDCTPCMDEFPHLNRDVWQQFHGANFEMFAISGDDAAALQAFQRKKSWSFPLASDSGNSFFTNFVKDVEANGFAGIPQTYLINRDGIIVGAANGFREGGDEFPAMVKSIAQELAKPTKPALP